MKFLTILISFFSLFAGQALAHTDHAVGDGSFHELYHVAFWTIFSIVAYKAFTWFKNKKSQKTH